MSRRNNKLVAAGLGLLLVAGVSGAALAAANTVSPSNAGQGEGTVAGFVVTDITYQPAGGITDPGGADVTVGTVTFDIVRESSSTEVASANADVYVQLRSGATLSSWVACPTTAGVATCDTESLDVTMASVDEVSVVAYDDANVG